MSENYTRDFSPEVMSKINSCNSIEEIREVMKAELERQGIAQRERDGSFTNVEPTHAQAQPAPASQQDAPTSNLLRRVISVKGCDWLISGRSEDELYRMEMAMKAAL
jgi:hypothetical protein